jgi:hypothetical protein
VKVYHDEQRTDAWKALRVGMVTGTCAADILAVRKRGSGELERRVTLRRRLVCERLTGRDSEDGTVTRAMRYGSEREPDAFRAYEARTGVLVKRVGFVAHDELMAGCSPDGYIRNWDGLLELKCPDSTTHLGYLLDGGIPEEYRPQLLHNLWITGAPWVDFVSFDDRLPEHRLFIRRLERNDTEIAAYELAVRLFLGEVEAELSKVQGLRAA